MAQLKEKLTLDPNRDIQEQFDEIASEILKNYHIEKKIKSHGQEEYVKYEFLEIECYYFCKEHPDFITYPRNSDAGNWFFHNSGVDITFESKIMDYDIIPCNTKKQKIITSGNFGGILVRSILKQTKGSKPQAITGPLKCIDELFNQFNALGITTDDFPTLKLNSKSNDDTKIKRCVRWIPPYTNKKVDEEKINRKKNNLLNLYSETFEKEKFETFIHKPYRYYREDPIFMEIKNYVAKP